MITEREEPEGNILAPPCSLARLGRSEVMLEKVCFPGMKGYECSPYRAYIWMRVIVLDEDFGFYLAYGFVPTSSETSF